MNSLMQNHNVCLELQENLRRKWKIYDWHFPRRSSRCGLCFFYTKVHIVLRPFLQLDFFEPEKGIFSSHYDSLRGFSLFHHTSNLLDERHCS